MRIRPYLHLLPLLVSLILILQPCAAHPFGQARIAVFNFDVLNLDAKGYDATVTNMLISFLERSPSLNILSRRELEAFLLLNDLQQNEDLSNVITIGNRLELDMIIVGNVRKSGPVIEINSKVARIAENSFIYDRKLRCFGDSGVRNEIRQLSLDISKAIELSTAKVRIPARKEKDLRAPVNVVCRPGSSTIGLHWEDASELGCKGYKIFRSESEGGPFVKMAQVTGREYLDKGLDKNTSYYYKIKAIGPQGRESVFSRTIHAETALTPNPPIIVGTEAHVHSVEITWSPNPIRSADPKRIVGYKLYRAKAKQGPYQQVSSLRAKDLGLGAETDIEKVSRINYPDNNLADGERYYYRVTAFNEETLESDPSHSMAGESIHLVQGVMAQGDMIRQIRVNWDAALSRHIQGYVVYRSTSKEEGYGKVETIYGRENTGFLDKEDLKDQTTYYYRVSLLETPGKEGSLSDPASATTKGPPPIPEGLRARSRMAKKVLVTWNVSPDQEVNGYRLYRSLMREGEYIQIGKISNRMKTEYLDRGTYDSPLEDDTEYYYYLTSYNKVDVQSLSSQVVCAVTKARPSRPMGLKGEGHHPRKVPLFWEPNPEGDIVSYHIFRSSGEDKEFSEVGSVGRKTSYLDDGLKDGHEYRYRIKAEDRDRLFSDFSETLTVETKPKPLAPRGLSVAFDSGNMILAWSANTEQDVAHYNVFEKGFLGLRRVGTAREPTLTKASPKPGKSKDYVVTAVDSDGLESEPSKPITVLGR